MHTALQYMLALFAVQLATPSAAELVLVENGESRMPVVIFEDAPPKTRRAADELAEYLEKMTDVRPVVLEGQPDPLPDSAIWVGYQPILDTLFPDMDLAFGQPEEVVIAANDNHLVIAGRDRWDPEHLTQQVRRREIEGVQAEYGTINAVYTFMQDYLGIRWFWPGELGEDVPRTNRIAFSPFQYRYHPQFRDRDGIFRLSALGLGWGNSYDWVRLQRLQLDSLPPTGGGHAFSDWWDRFHAHHPEFFALQPDGTRGGGEIPYPKAKSVKMCKSNPELWAQWLADVEAALAGNPTLRVFNAAANDSSRSGYCVCERCLAWDHPEGALVRYMWQGISQEYVAMSDRQVTFANTLGRLLNDRFPDQDHYVSILAYGASLTPPASAVPDDNVIVSGVFNFHKRKDPTGRDLLRGWGAVAPNVGWRPNLGYGPIHADGLPDVSPAAVFEDLRLAADCNVVGINFDTIWEHWATQGLHYYLLAQLAWDPYADGKAILEDYYQRGFGQGAEDIRNYWDVMAAGAYAITFEEKPREAVYDAEFLARATTHLDRAGASVSDAPDVYRRRIEFLRMGLDYTRYLMEADALMQQFRDGDARDTALEDQARQIWREHLLPLINCEEHPYAFNHIYLKPGNRTLGGATGPYPADLMD